MLTSNKFRMPATANCSVVVSALFIAVEHLAALVPTPAVGRLADSFIGVKVRAECSGECPEAGRQPGQPHVVPQRGGLLELR